MQAYQHPTAPGGVFTDGDPGTGVPSTVMVSAWPNAVQTELLEAIEEAGLTPSGVDLTQLTQAIKILAAGAGGLKNTVMNGDFQLWQRGVTFAGIGTAERYTADRWAVTGDGASGAGVATVTRQAFTAGQTDVPGAQQFLQYQQTTGSTAGGGKIVTKLEALEQLANGSVTVSLWVKAASAITVGLNLVNVYGPVGSTAVATSALSVTTTWQRLVRTFQLPSVAGQSISQGLAHLRLELALPAGTPFFQVARVQLERASIASPFEVRPLALELGLCRRYFEKSYELDVAPGTGSIFQGAQTADDVGGDIIATLQARFAVPKRAIPTIAWYSPTSGALGKLLRFTDSVELNIAETFHISRVTSGWPRINEAWGDSRLLLVHWTADAEL